MNSLSSFRASFAAVTALELVSVLAFAAPPAGPLLPARPPSTPVAPADPADALAGGLPDTASSDLERRTGSFRADYPLLPPATSSSLVALLYKRVNFAPPAGLTRDALWDQTLVEDAKIAEQNPGKAPAPKPPARAGGVPMPAGATSKPASQPSRPARPPRDPNPGYLVYVPKDYRPGRPYGLIVFNDPGGGGSIDRHRGYAALCDKHRLIWVAPADTGNDRPTPWRLYRGTEALLQARRRFTIDPQRTYVSGMSGGGRISSIAALVFADLYAGGLYLDGCNYPANLPAEPGRVYPGFWPRPDAALLARAKRDGRYVLLTGTKDFNRDGTKLVYDAYTRDGFKHATYLEVPDMGHTMPPAEWFAKGLAALDAPLPSPAELAKAAADAAATGRADEAFLLHGRAAALAAAAGDDKTAAAEDAAAEGLYAGLHKGAASQPGRRP